MVWCRPGENHYLNQCWLIYRCILCITWPQWANHWHGEVEKFKRKHKNIFAFSGISQWQRSLKSFLMEDKDSCILQLVPRASFTNMDYHQTSNRKHIFVGNKIVDHTDVAGASPIGTAPTTSSFSTQHLASMDWAKTTARRHEEHLSLRRGLPLMDISNHTPSKARDEINFNSCCIDEVWEWICNFIPHIIMSVITYQYWDQVNPS